jgi:hypothetical protein
MSKQPPNPPSPDDLANLIEGKDGQSAPSGDTQGEQNFGMRIGRDGTWYYLGTPIKRLPLVKLFSTVLWRDDKGDFWLVTPVERGRIDVDDAPFVAVGLTVEGEGQDTLLTFRTNLDEEIVAGVEHPIRVEIDPETEEPTPYIHVRDNLEALIARSVFYDLAEMAEEATVDDGIELRVWSRGNMFCLGNAGPGD